MTGGEGREWLSGRTRAAEEEIGTPFDLSVCVKEPIHRLGGVQSYGALIAVRSGVVAVASENAPAMLGDGARPGAPLTGVLDAAQIAALESLAAADTGQTAMMPLTIGAGDFDVTVHRADGLLVLEFEPSAGPAVFTPFYAPVRQALVRMQQAVTVEQACRAAVREVRAITGYDRVVAYRFESADGPGEVIAEDVSPGLEPWRGLWFPATDIPPQARRLYEQNWIRVIADAGDTSARLVPETLPGTGQPLDLSHSVLRTVSEFHLEYLRNIGVVSSMSVSLLTGGRLWGLIACHGRAPKPLDPQVRAGCEFFGVALSLHLAALRERDEATARERSRAVIARLTESLADDLLTGWSGGPAGLTEVVECDAVAVRTGATLTVHGAELTEAAIGLMAVLPDPVAGQMWHSDRLAEDLPGLPKSARMLGGALVLPLSAAGDCIVWLRRERTVQRRWAADPDTPVVLGPHGRRLTPRGSTAVFLASVRGRGMPWSATDLAMVTELGRAIMRVAVAHTRQLSDLNSELRRSNVELDSFAHAAAHDLKEPLRGIANTATFIAEDAGDGMDETTVRRLESIQRLATRMDELLNALLYYSRLGRTELQRERVRVRDATERAMEVAGPRLEQAGVRVDLPDPMVSLSADPVLFGEVLTNLLVNAAKYARPEGPRRVAVGAAPAVPPGLSDRQPALFVRDNGIGMPEHLRDEAFQLFRRLHAASIQDGSGAGLAIVRRIVERHGGQVWAEESPEGGTTMWATFPDGR